MKRLVIAVAALFMAASSSFAAGTVPGFSLAQQQDSNGTPLVGCKLYTIQAGTVSTPQSGYQDSALTLPLSNPIICDAYGRLPQIFLADGSIKLRLTKSNGVQVFAADGILVVGASSGGGGGSPVDATTILATGDIKPRYGTGVLSGFVRANGRTIGSATSGATERANADCQTLFEYLWAADANLPVSTGRGASAAADWSANKTITLPDLRGRVVAGLDDMGNSAAGRLTASYFGLNTGGVAGTTLGAVGGAEKSALLSVANMPPYTPTGTVPTGISGRFIMSYSTVADLAVSLTAGPTHIPVSTTTTQWSANTTIGFTGDPQGSSTAFATMSPALLASIYIKL